MEDTQQQAKRYSRVKTRLTVSRLLLTALFLVFLLLSGLSAGLAETAAGLSGSFYIQVGFYLLMFGCIHYVLFLGLDFYGGFVLEHKFQLSNETVTRWLKRSLKKLALSLLMLLVVGQALYFFLKTFPDNWWLFMAAAWLGFTLVLGKILPVIIIPLFYKCSPLTDEQLEDRLLWLAQTCRVDVTKVFEIRLSKETKKINAGVAGWGKGRRILMGDTLLQNYTHDEIEAVFAHELAHIRLLHIWKSLAFAAVVSLASFYLTYLLFGIAAASLGYAIHDVAAFALLALFLMGIGLVLMPLQLAFSRRLEKQADLFALEHIEDGECFASAITKLAGQNLADPSPSRLQELLLYDHPPISKRLAYIRSAANAGCTKG